MGLIVNMPTEGLSTQDVLAQLDIKLAPSFQPTPVQIGGPVETGRGFVLHGTDYESALHSLMTDPGICMTATLDILEDIGEGKGPETAIFLLGYAGWAGGQLESEIAANGWLTVPADTRIVFDTPNGQKWQAALEKLGIDPISLSGVSGRA